MHDDLPAPVAPAMRMCGIMARLSITGRPLMSRPMAASSGWVAFAASVEPRMSPNATVSRSSLGTSMPIARCPGIGARIRTSAAASS